MKLKNSAVYGNPEENFFEQNREWRYLDSSTKMLEDFGEELASKLRWAIYMIEDPSSDLHRLDKSKAIELINKNYLKGDYELEFNPDRMEIGNEQLEHAIKAYPEESMSYAKRDYYEREKSYRLLMESEREMSDEYKRAQVQEKLNKIYDSLKERREEFQEEEMQERAKTQGKQQPGRFFNS